MQVTFNPTISNNSQKFGHRGTRFVEQINRWCDFGGIIRDVAEAYAGGSLTKAEAIQTYREINVKLPEKLKKLIPDAIKYVETYKFK